FRFRGSGRTPFVPDRSEREGGEDKGDLGFCQAHDLCRRNGGGVEGKRWDRSHGRLGNGSSKACRSGGGGDRSILQYHGGERRNRDAQTAAVKTSGQGI